MLGADEPLIGEERNVSPTTDVRCPVCGRGVLRELAFDQQLDDPERIEQQPDARQTEDYSCGHRVVGSPLRAADRRLDVERRGSEEGAEPLPER